MATYTAHFFEPDSNGKTRRILFGAEQTPYTLDQGVAFSTCQLTADITGEQIVIVEQEMREPNVPATGWFHTIHHTESRLHKTLPEETEA